MDARLKRPLDFSDYITHKLNLNLEQEHAGVLSSGPDRGTAENQFFLHCFVVSMTS
jgi:hypothetical protein